LRDASSMFGEVECACPLIWPTGKPRTPINERNALDAATHHKPSLGYFLRRIRRGLIQLGADAIVVSANLKLPQEASAPECEDPGVCVQFAIGSTRFEAACDRFQTITGNIIALARHFEATITLQSHGVVSTAEALCAFALTLDGVAADKTWRDILGDVSQPEQVNAAFRRQSTRHHPDKSTGSHEAMAELSWARDEALRELRSRGDNPSRDELIVFESTVPFGAMRAAERFLAERGFSCGENQRGAPRGILAGAYYVRRWSDLSDLERRALDGTMTGDMRLGPVTVTINHAATVRASWPIRTDAAWSAQRHRSQRTKKRT
jgi:hypothetical protein